WAPFVYKVLVQVHPGSVDHPGLDITPSAQLVMEDIMADTAARLVAAASHCRSRQWSWLAKTTGNCINLERMEMAVRLVLKPELAKHGLHEGNKAVDKFGG
ncbi:hypothetical protein T484DRAFT_1603576, partial [Baffinella frigidus]